MLIAAVLCFSAAAVTAALGLWQLGVRASRDPRRQALRTVAPTQLAAAVMLAAGATIALLSQPAIGLVVMTVSVVGAVSTVAAGCWQSAKAVAASTAVPAQPADACGGACATCTLSCS